VKSPAKWKIALCESMGLDPSKVMKVEIVATAGDFPHVTVTYLPDFDAGPIECVEQRCRLVVDDDAE